MCYLVYIATNQPQKISQFVPEETILYLDLPKQDAEIRGVKSKFTKSYMYYVGSHSKCSCGFNYIQSSEDSFEEDRKSAEALILLIQTLAQKETIEFYCCWAGDWEENIEETSRIDSKTIILEENYFGLTERQFIVFD